MVAIPPHAPSPIALLSASSPQPLLPLAHAPLSPHVRVPHDPPSVSQQCVDTRVPRGPRALSLRVVFSPSLLSVSRGHVRLVALSHVRFLFRVQQHQLPGYGGRVLFTTY
jgi:hypothetical protein